MTTYRDSGVDIDAQDRALAQIKKMVRNTYTDNVLSDQGAFGGLFRMPVKGFKEPVLVASADGGWCRYAADCWLVLFWRRRIKCAHDRRGILATTVFGWGADNVERAARERNRAKEAKR